ncbi:hypothetical protein PIROE2DRAFT_6171 [Piromyces sp. E2]|nr:hypothetical protein PIROE2DRAFT_6171 [Piromyces sp. E2]|eukprot:OUM66550.1 hypothetical protein PIROE2DRAFT_6171 [Piromyces sp. E2]
MIKKKNWMKKKKIKSEEKYGKGKKPKGFYKNQNKIERIEKLLVIEKEKGWKLFKLFEECPKIVSEFKKKSNFRNITNIEKMENAKDIINVIINNSNIDQKNSDVINNNDIYNKKNNLLILCFDLIYNCIINNNADEGMKMYLYRNHKDFIKNYNIGHSRENDIVIIDEETKEKNEEENNEKINKEENNEKNEEDKNEMELRNNNKQYKKRKCPEEEYSIELDEKRPRIDKCSGDSSKQTNKNSDSEVLLVDRFLS